MSRASSWTAFPRRVPAQTIPCRFGERGRFASRTISCAPAAAPTAVRPSGNFGRAHARVRGRVRVRGRFLHECCVREGHSGRWSRARAIDQVVRQRVFHSLPIRLGKRNISRRIAHFQGGLLPHAQTTSLAKAGRIKLWPNPPPAASASRCPNRETASAGLKPSPGAATRRYPRSRGTRSRRSSSSCFEWILSLR